MTTAGAIAHGAPAPPAAAGRAQPAFRSVYRAERRKLTAQLATRLLALVCVVGPFAFAAILKAQSGSPTDALFGVWVHSSGFAVSLVVLGFAGSWGFPLVAGVLAGDMFSSEDRYGTWKTVLTRSCTRSDVFVGKVLAAMTFTAGLVTLAAVASLLAGVTLVGPHALVGLSGNVLSPGRCVLLVLAAWLFCLLPALAFTSLAVLFSVLARNGIVGVLGPALVALVTQLLGLVGRGVWAHMLLIGTAFDGWHGLFTSPLISAPLVLAAVVSLLWTAACLLGAWLAVRGRDFAGVTAQRRFGWALPVKVVAVSAAVIALLAFASNWGPSGVTPARLRASITPVFNRLTVLQQRQLGRDVPAGATLHVLTNCSRGAAHRRDRAIGPAPSTCSSRNRRHCRSARPRSATT